MGGYALFFALVVLAPDVLEAPALARQVLGPPRARTLGVTCLSLGQQLFPVSGPLAGVLQVAGGRRALVPSVLQARALEEVVPERVEAPVLVVIISWRLMCRTSWSPTATIVPPR